MKSLVQYLEEKLIIKKNKTTNYRYLPKTKEELQYIILKRIKNEGNEVNLNELMIRRAAQTVYVLADHTKIETRSSFRTCGIDRVTHLITDELAPKEAIDMYRERGIQVHQVGKNDLIEVR